MNGNRIHKLLEKASGFLEVGDFTNAELNYREVLSLAQNHSVALNNLGVIAFRTQRYALAMQYFEAVLQIEPDNSAFVLNLANTLHTLGYWEMLHHLLDTKDKVLGGAGVHLKNMVFGKKIGRKLFCVGFNKTGTTSLELALSSLGFHMGNQARGELLFRDWCNRKFERIIQLATTADAFQDIPFSLPYTFQVMDLSFPDAKFILTVRDDPEQWYQSISTFHAKIVNGGDSHSYVRGTWKFSV